uniref:probable ATP-dependent RNA helicase DDX31 n=1 Tax=Panthera onca TaxID=9690 RepID=UPI002954674B
IDPICSLTKLSSSLLDFNIFIAPVFPLVILKGLPLLAPRWLPSDFTVIKSIIKCFIIPDSDSVSSLILPPPSQKSRAAGPQEIRQRATVLQTVFEDYVHSSERRVSWAKKALQSFIRAYATYPRELKHIFHVRSLHLGHVAKSFGLRDAPQNLGVSAVKRRKGNLNRPDLRKKTRGKHCLAEILRSEYSSGIEASVAKVKKQNKHAVPGSQPCRAIRTGRPASAVGKQKKRPPCNGKTQRD